MIGPKTQGLAAVDLNLLVALDALLREQNVTRAARRVGLSQPSMSHALARLRELFGDPLLVRAGRGMVLTPRAEGLAAPLTRLLGEAARLIEEEAGFDPATSTRSFTLVGPDLLVSFLPRLLAAMRAEAPQAVLRVARREGDLVKALAEGEAELALGPLRPEEGSAPGLMRRALGHLRWGVLRRRDHPSGPGPLTLAGWLAHPHIVIESGGSSPNIIAAAVAKAGAARRVGLVLPSFSAAPPVVARTDLFFNGPLEMLLPYARDLDLELHPLPLPLPQLAVGALWHERVHADPGHRWLREKVAGAVAWALSEDLAEAGVEGSRQAPPSPSGRAPRRGRARRS